MSKLIARGNLHGYPWKSCWFHDVISLVFLGGAVSHLYLPIDNPGFKTGLRIRCFCQGLKVLASFREQFAHSLDNLLRRDQS